LLGNPKVTAAQLIDFIVDTTTAAGAKVDANVRNFLSELGRNRRLDLLPEVAGMFATMRANIENVAEVAVTSAVALSDTQRDRLAAALKKRLRKEVRMQCSVDAGLLGGAIVRCGDFVIDGSLRAGLERLRGAIAT
jgi:F-type H+-transporting ATPase subunit delta